MGKQPSMMALQILPLEKKTAKLRKQSEDYLQKRALIEEYKENYEIELTHDEQKKFFREIDHIGLEIALKRKLRKKVERDAAVQIQSAFRGYICLKWYRVINAIRNGAALKLQKAWKRY